MDEHLTGFCAKLKSKRTKFSWCYGKSSTNKLILWRHAYEFYAFLMIANGYKLIHLLEIVTLTCHKLELAPNTKIKNTNQSTLHNQQNLHIVKILHSQTKIIQTISYKYCNHICIQSQKIKVFFCIGCITNNFQQT